MTFSRLARSALFLAPTALVAVIALSVPACTGMPEGCPDVACEGNTLCDTGTGECVGCLTSADCEDGGGCCDGACIAPAEFENNCGCEPAQGAGLGSTCPAGQPICTLDGFRVNGADLADGTCQTPCYPELGGTISAVDNTAARGFDCTCSGADDDGTCNGPFLRTDGLPHRGSDLCDPNDKCTCYNGPVGNAGCSAATPDCDGLAGCINLHTDASNCGLPSQDCTLPENGPDDATGVCVHGGCTCNQASDCTGTGANTDSCQLIGDGTVNQCVCDDYTENGEKSACPLQLACVAGGCQLDGQVYATLADVLDALDLDGMSLVTDNGTDGGS